MTQAVSLHDIEAARRSIAGLVERTPLVEDVALSGTLGVPVWLKLENLQKTGSFKLRGAANFIARTPPELCSRGLVTISTGNHGRAVAFAARQFGLKATICLSELVPANKVEAIRALGAEVVTAGRSQDEAELVAETLIADKAMIMVPPFDDPAIIAGQGTIALELVEDLADIETVIVAISGGGLISGIARALKALMPGVRIIGVGMERGAAMYHSLRAGKPVQVEELPTLADALGGGIGLANRFTFAMVRDLVDDYVLLSEPQIAAAIRHLHRQHRLMVEGAGAVTVGALMAGLAGDLRGPAVAIVSGGSIAPDLFQRILEGHVPSH